MAGLDLRKLICLCSVLILSAALSPTANRAKGATTRAATTQSAATTTTTTSNSNSGAGSNSGPITNAQAANQKPLNIDITTNHGNPISDDQNSEKAGVRGPSLLEDFWFREKMTHFDHERIPERVVHARGYGVHGYFESDGDISDLSMASVFKPGKQTEVFLRFSTVAGSRGSMDTARDVRGFAVKFYTDEGNWDMVGNNIPVFFIQDAIKFPDIIHAVKPEPNNEIPQAQSAHDTFWDFVSLTPESAHMLMWIMSDRAIPRSFAAMEGFGVHTFRLVNSQGRSRFVKFHFKPVKGLQSLVWDEAQKLGGKDPDFHRRDLYDAIEAGLFPEWEVGVQVVEESQVNDFEFDILDATKLIPEEMVPVRRIGKLVLNRNPDNYFAETEQAAFHLGNLVPGIDITEDPLLQGRLFSYIDTQLLRVGPNFHQLPTNRPKNAKACNNERDGFARQTVEKGRVSYYPSGLSGANVGGCPMRGGARSTFKSYAQPVTGTKIRARSESFSDYFSQASMFWNSMADWEKAHIIDAFSFELNQCTDDGVRNRVMNEILVNINPVLASGVSNKTGIAVAGNSSNLTPSAINPSGRKSAKMAAYISPSLSMARNLTDIKGRKIALLCGDGVNNGDLNGAKQYFTTQGAFVEVVANHRGTIKASDGSDVKVDRPLPNAAAVLYDACVIVGGNARSMKPLVDNGMYTGFVIEQFRHYKPIGSVGQGSQILQAAQLPNGASDQGLFTGNDGSSVAQSVGNGLLNHRYFYRNLTGVPMP